MSSNLTGTFIANTYQKLLQVDTDNGSVGSTAPFSATNAKTTSKHNILNGLGQSVGGLVIDQTGVSGFNGGLYLKNTTSGANNDSKASWTLQTSGDGGFNISRGGEDNYKLFLKQSGSVWVGYDNSNVPASDVSGYSLYVNNGIYMTGSNPGILANENNFNFYMNSTSGTPYHPFKIRRYSMFWTSPQVNNKTLVDEFSNTISSTDWSAVVVGFNCDSNQDIRVNNLICMVYRNSGIWKLRVGLDGDGAPASDQTWNIDIMFIRKGWYDDTSRNGFGQPFIDIQI